MNVLRRAVVFILTLEARAVLWRYRPHIIAVTGSVGKTSTKDAIYAGLCRTLHVRKSEKSFNSEVGVPLTILGSETGWKNPVAWFGIIVRGLLLIAWRQTYPQWLVLEVGADRPGGIARTARWVRPDIAVITSVPDVPAHVEYFESAEHLAGEKKALARYVKPDGKLILNSDDERVRTMKAEFRGITLTYGIATPSDFSASHQETTYEAGVPTGVKFRVERAGSSVPVVLRGALGTPRVYASLAACAAAEAAGVDVVTVADGLSRLEPAPGRMRVLQGIHGSILIDDTYNSSPHAATAALDTLASVGRAEENSGIPPGRLIAVLGDMLELGRFSAAAHRQVGEHAAKCADTLITVGLRARNIAEGAHDGGMKKKQITEYGAGEAARAGEELAKLLQPGDFVLIKGSQGMRMEKAVKELLAEPTRAAGLLVRQDKEWEKR